jgi:hypothetical protein
MVDYSKLVKITRVAAASSALVFALGAGGAFASIDLSGSNDTTGPSSENTNFWKVNNNSEIDIHNDAHADNNLDFDASSGRNEVEHNTEVGDILTGDISGDISVENMLNSADVEMAMDEAMGDVSVDLANDTTGPNSRNKNVVVLNMDRNIDIRNDARIDNDVDLEANTGRNEVEHNTVAGDFQSGDVNFDMSVDNAVNGSMGSIDLGGMGAAAVSADFSNGTTGPSSENENKLIVNAGSEVDIHNDAHIDNNADINVNSGRNEVGSNTVVGNVGTGSIDISYSVTNSAN